MILHSKCNALQTAISDRVELIFFCHELPALMCMRKLLSCRENVTTIMDYVHMYTAAAMSWSIGCVKQFLI